MTSSTRTIPGLVLALTLVAAGCAAPPAAEAPAQQVFPTPEAAVRATADLIGDYDPGDVERVFGPGSVELFASGDPDADRADYRRVKEMITARVAFDEIDADTRVALFGEQAWPWPIPLVRSGTGWRYDTEAGRGELLNRRIGHNELWTLTALREVVAAQHEYRAIPRDGRSPAYAARFRSTPGQHDGLWWPVDEGQPRSPLGDLLAESDVVATTEPRPFHGYFYRILDAQGPSAPGGERSYRDESGALNRGFAVVAWPARHGSTGVMTFLTNQQGIVFQKDLGPDTSTLAEAITRFDPDESWDPTADTVTDAEAADGVDAE